MIPPSLPQHEPDPERRRRQIAAREAAAPVVYDRFDGVAMAPAVPPSDQPELSWLARVAEVLVEIGVNAAEVGRISVLHPDHPEHDAALTLIRDAERGGLHAALDHLQALTQGEDDGGQPTSLDDYKALFRKIPLPPSAAEVDDDLAFARMRIAGPNPMQLARVAALPEALAVDEAVVARATGALAKRGIDTAGGTLAASLAEGRAFVADYSALQGAPGGTWAGRSKHLYAPIALFLAVGRTRTLVPVAIQPGPQPEPGRPALTPADGQGWAVARAMATVADGNLHQAVVHLAHTHLVMEACALAARRHLAEQHPVARLLEPHLEGTLYINDAAETKLAAPGGGVDAVMGGPIAFSRAAATSAVRSWSFLGAMLERDLAARGLDDLSVLPEHPYRDDARLVHGAIARWVEGVVRTFYASDADVSADGEIQAMFRWLGADDGGRLRDVPMPRTVADLVAAIAHIVFTASAQHAAVNFPQLPIMSYAPAYPLAGYHPATDPAATGLLEILPPLGPAHYQATLGTLLGSVHHSLLGTYPDHLLHNFLGDARITPYLEAFRQDLSGIERLIEHRNRARAPYPFLLPSRIPRSVNI